jgi:hypothetical protein
LLVFAIAQLISSCKQRCDGFVGECGEGSYCAMPAHRCQTDCFSDEECRSPIECRANPENCSPKGLYCASGQCRGPVGERPPPEMIVETLEEPPEGWDWAVGEGATFVMNSIEVAGQGVGLDLDGDRAVDNRLWEVADGVNPFLRQGLGGGAVLLLVEIAGLDKPYTGEDESVTLKIYGGIDADFPIDALDNFDLPPGREGPCCEFRVDSRWLTIENMDQVAAVRAPARIRNHRLEAPTNFPYYSFDVQFALTVGQPPYQFVNIAKSRMQFELDSDLETIRRGVIGGGLQASSLARIDNPFCPSSPTLCPFDASGTSLLDLTAFLAGPSPDVDVDGDGRECTLDTTGDQVIDLCCEGSGTQTCNRGDRTCPDAPIPPVDADPRSCTRSIALSDGYSIGFTFTAVQAAIVGSGTSR